MKKGMLRRMDFTLLMAALGIIIMSLVIIGSATHINTPGEERYYFVQRQGIFTILNIAAAAFLFGCCGQLSDVGIIVVHPAEGNIVWDFQTSVVKCQRLFIRNVYLRHLGGVSA